MSCLVGNQIDDYTILGFLGAGGRGEAYLAHDKTKQKKVLKVCARTTT